MIALVGSVLGASLLGSLHCAGMCGGFVVFYSGAEGTRRTTPHVAYNVGRLLSYVAVGAIAGALGHGIDRLGHRTGLERAAAIAAGALMIGWGALTLVRLTRARTPHAASKASRPSPIGGLLRAVRTRPPWVRGLALGLATTWLPCGWLWAFAATASATASPGWGALAMAAFWLGTLPVMAGLAMVAQRAFGPLRARLPAVTAATLVVLGLLTIAGKFHPPCASGGSETVHVCH